MHEEHEVQPTSVRLHAAVEGRRSVTPSWPSCLR